MGFFDFFKSEQKWNGYNKPYDVRDVADCIMLQPCSRDITNKELCCILYWIQADFLVVLGRKCFDSQIKAYHDRLSIRELTENLTWFGSRRNIAPQDEPRIIEMIYKVKDHYSSADEMMQTIKKQKPYLRAIESGSYVIDEKDLKKYFDRLDIEEKDPEVLKVPKKSALETALFQLNINIPQIKDGEFKNKLYGMHDAINNVLIAVGEKPTKEKDVRRLAEYYIPTMVKLLGKYSRLSESGRKTPEIEKTIKDIESLPDEIIKVANAVYDDIMEENLIDINADISVLKQKAEGDKGINEFERKFTEVKECEDGPDYKRLKQVNLHICLFEWRMNEITPDETKEEYAFVADVQEYWWFDFNENRWRKCFKEDIDDLRMNKFWRTKVC